MELLIIYSAINVRNPVSVSTDASYLDRSLNIERISMGASYRRAAELATAKATTGATV